MISVAQKISELMEFYIGKSYLYKRNVHTLFHKKAVNHESSAI